MPEQEMWEYKVVRLVDDSEKDQETLQKLGKERWELVSVAISVWGATMVSSNPKAYLKRKFIPPKA